MCSPKQAEDAAATAITKVLLTQDPITGKTKLQEEMDGHFDKRLKDLENGTLKKMIRWMIGSIATGATLIIVMVAGWVSLSHDVAENNAFRETGARFNLERGEALEKRVEVIESDIKNLATKDDISRLEKSINVVLATLLGKEI